MVKSKKLICRQFMRILLFFPTECTLRRQKTAIFVAFEICEQKTWVIII